MATLLFTQSATAAGDDLTTGHPSLRSWLKDSWTILFSHPEDFVRYDMESDRWLTIMQRALAERLVRPLALTRNSPDLDRSWIADVTGDDRVVAMDGGSRRGADMIDVRARLLRDAIAGTERRFVMVIDSLLNIRRLFTYEAGARVPSPLAVLGWVDSLREADSAPVVADRVAARPVLGPAVVAAIGRHHFPIRAERCEMRWQARAG